MAARGELPQKLVHHPNSHLVCGLCEKVFTDPVISTACGHTFCRPCLLVSEDSPPVSCPSDGISCAADATVPNRALQGQLDDLDIYCRYGLSWSEKEAQFVLDKNGCKEVIKLGTRDNHEGKCLYALVPCPNNEDHCGNFRKIDLDMHLRVCAHAKCKHQSKGCKFVGRLDEVNWHSERCGYRPGAQVCPAEVEELQMANRELKTTVLSLTQRVSDLEKVHAATTNELRQCQDTVRTMESKFNDIHEKLDQLLKMNTNTVKRAPDSSATAPLERSPSVRPLSRSVMKRVELWTMPFQFRCIGTLRAHRSPVLSLTTDGQQLFSAGGDNTVKVWDLDGLAKGHKMTLKGHTDVIQALSVGTDYLYSTGNDMSLFAWNRETGQQELVVQNAHEDSIVAMVSNEDYVFTSSFSTIHVWEAATLSKAGTISGLHHWVRALALNYGGDKLYSGSHNTIEVWDSLGKFMLKGKINHKFGSIHALLITSQHIIAGTYNQNIQVFDVTSQQHVFSLSGHVGTITSLQVSPSGNFLFSGSSDNTIQVWNLQNNLPIQRLARHENSVNAVLLHGDMLLSGSDDNEIKVFTYFSMS